MQGVQFATFDFTPFQSVVYIHRASWFEAYQSKVLPMSPRSTAPNFTPKQGQYLAFIYAYTHVLGRPPGVTPLNGQV